MIFQLNAESNLGKILAARRWMPKSIHPRSRQLMLVLTRLPNEAILIGDDIEITVLTITANTVRLRITCPRMDPPVREETLRFDNLLSISGNVEVRVVSVRPEGGRVRLGVKAPRSIPIAREEAREQYFGNQISR